jgi:hypothetical protein
MQHPRPELTLTILVNILAVYWMTSCTSCFEDQAVYSAQGISEVPKNLTENLVRLDLSNNNITTINKHDFYKLGQVKVIDLSYNNIHIVHEDSFEHVVCLEELDLSYNNIVHLPLNIFRSNQNLKQLYLKKNRLQIMGDSSKAQHILDSGSLTYLDVSFCNITCISSEALSGLPNLETLIINGNPLTRANFEITKPPRKLKKLQIDCCSSSTSETYRCNWQERIVETTLLPPCLPTPQTKTNEDDQADPVVLVSIIMCAGIFTITVTSYVLIARYKSRKNEVINEDHNLVRATAIQQRPLPPPPLEDYEVPITPRNEYNLSVSHHNLQINRNSGYAPVSLVENDGRTVPGTDRVPTDTNHGSRHSLSCSTEYQDGVPYSSNHCIYSCSEMNEEDENNFPIPPTKETSSSATTPLFPRANRPSRTCTTSTAISLRPFQRLGSPPEDGRFKNQKNPFPPASTRPTSTCQASSIRNVTTFCVKKINSEKVYVSSTCIELEKGS